MKCEFCGQDNKNISWLGIRYKKVVDMVLCDRCVDKIFSHNNGTGVDYYWTDRDAERNGLCPFPRNKPIPNIIKTDL